MPQYDKDNIDCINNADTIVAKGCVGLKKIFHQLDFFVV
jgi:hypothetical protein